MFVAPLLPVTDSLEAPIVKYCDVYTCNTHETEAQIAEVMGKWTRRDHRCKFSSKHNNDAIAAHSNAACALGQPGLLALEILTLQSGVSSRMFCSTRWYLPGRSYQDCIVRKGRGPGGVSGQWRTSLSDDDPCRADSASTALRRAQHLTIVARSPAPDGACSPPFRLLLALVGALVPVAGRAPLLRTGSVCHVCSIFELNVAPTNRQYRRYDTSEAPRVVPVTAACVGFLLTRGPT
eukprot:SAG11_NODE_158_length_14064_cov_6.063860_2_plen_236_part_00